jgi:gliding motility-associated-like protein
LAAGSHLLFVKDNNNCLDTISAIIYEPDTILMNIDSIGNTLCFNSIDGFVDFGATGGIYPYEFSISPLDSSNSDGLFINLDSGIYIISIIDYNGCSFNSTVTVSQPDSLWANVSELQKIDCYGESNGILEINAFDGTSGYFFSIDGITFSQDSIFNGLNAGIYPYWVKDMNSCTFIDTITILEPDSLEFDISIASIITCAGANNGQLQVEVSGGIYPYRATILDDTFIGNDFLFSDLSAGEYLVLVIDSNECISQQSFILQEPDPLVAEIAPVELTCFGDNNGIGIVNTAGGFGAYNYQWDNLTQDQSQITQSNLIAGITYSVIIRDTADANCLIIEYVTPTQPPPILFDILPLSESCDSTDIAVRIEVSTGGVFPFQYAVNDEQPVNSSYFEDLSPVNTKFSVIDYTACVFEGNFVPYNPNLTKAFFEIDQVDLSIVDPYTTLYDMSTNRDTLKWDFGDKTSVSGSVGTYINEDHSTGPITKLNHEYQSAGFITTRLTTISSFGCSDFYEIMVRVSEDHKIYIPNSFSPNGDGINDVFYIQGSTIREDDFSLQIYNRANKLVFISTNVNYGWDGIGKDGKEVSIGVYIYLVKLNSGGERITKTGSITLIR